MKKIILTLMLLFISTVMYASDTTVTTITIDVTKQTNYYKVPTTIQITHKTTGKKFNWNVYLSIDSGLTYLPTPILSSTDNDMNNVEDKLYSITLSYKAKYARLKIVSDGPDKSPNYPNYAESRDIFSIEYGTINWDSVPNFIAYNKPYYLSWIGNNLPEMTLKYRLYTECSVDPAWKTIKNILPTDFINSYKIEDCYAKNVEFGIFYLGELTPLITTAGKIINKYTCDDVIEYKDSINNIKDLMIAELGKKLKDSTTYLHNIIDSLSLEVKDTTINLKYINIDGVTSIEYFTKEINYNLPKELEPGTKIWIFDVLGNIYKGYPTTLYNGAGSEWTKDIKNESFVVIYKNNNYFLYKFIK